MYLEVRDLFLFYRFASSDGKYYFIVHMVRSILNALPEEAQDNGLLMRMRDIITDVTFMPQMEWMQSSGITGLFLAVCGIFARLYWTYRVNSLQQNSNTEKNE